MEKRFLVVFAAYGNFIVQSDFFSAVVLAGHYYTDEEENVLQTLAFEYSNGRTSAVVPLSPGSDRFVQQTGSHTVAWSPMWFDALPANASPHIAVTFPFTKRGARAFPSKAALETWMVDRACYPTATPDEYRSAAGELLRAVDLSRTPIKTHITEWQTPLPDENRGFALLSLICVGAAILYAVVGTPEDAARFVLQTLGGRNARVSTPGYMRFEAENGKQYYAMMCTFAKRQMDSGLYACLSLRDGVWTIHQVTDIPQWRVYDIEGHEMVREHGKSKEFRVAGQTFYYLPIRNQGPLTPPISMQTIDRFF